MATNPKPVPAPVESKMMDDNNMCTPVWAHFFNTIYRFQKNQNETKADGTYTTGEGGVTDGTITLENGVITAIQEAS